MKTIRLLFEYGSNNVFLYDDDGSPLQADLPEEVIDDREITSLRDRIAERFDSTYEDENGEFDQIRTGPMLKTAREEMDFVRDVCHFVKLLKDKLGDRYRFVDEYWTTLERFYWPEE